MDGKVLKCRLTQDFKSSKKIMNGKKLQFKKFVKGEVVTGSTVNHSSTPANYVAVFKTTQGYIIPKSYLHPIGEARPSSNDVQEAVVVEDNDYVSQNSINKVKTATANFSGTKLIESAKLRSKYAVNGAIGGLLVGVVYAMVKGGNKFIYGAMGTVLGGFVGNAYTNFKEDKK